MKLLFEAIFAATKVVVKFQQTRCVKLRRFSSAFALAIILELSSLFAAVSCFSSSGDFESGVAVVDSESLLSNAVPPDQPKRT